MSNEAINNTFVVKAGLARMLKGGVIMDVVNVEQAKIAEAAGAVAVMALERIPADIRYDGGVARMSDPDMIRNIKAAVTIPVMAKVNCTMRHIWCCNMQVLNFEHHCHCHFNMLYYCSGQNRALRGGSDPGGHRDRLHRRE